jgi:hypothetical protein
MVVEAGFLPRSCNIAEENDEGKSMINRRKFHSTMDINVRGVIKFLLARGQNFKSIAGWQCFFGEDGHPFSGQELKAWYEGEK